MRKGIILTNQSGSTIVLVLLLMVVLLGFTALVIDAGLIYLNKTKMVNALDSAVLAGVQELPDDPDAALTVATEYALHNKIKMEEINSITVGEDNRTISATASRQLSLFFARSLGAEFANINAYAKAQIESISTAVGVVPFGILEQELHFGQTMVLKEGGGDGDTGWFNALSLGANGASTYLENIKYGYNEEIKVGQTVPTEAGNMSGPTKTGIEYRNGQCQHMPHCSADSFVEGCPRILIIPVIRITDVDNSGNVSYVQVLGFAAFLVDGYVGDGNDNEVQGTFIRYVIPGETGEGAGDYGLYGSRLVE